VQEKITEIENKFAESQQLLESKNKEIGILTAALSIHGQEIGLKGDFRVSIHFQ
jgi:hypothetical protein